MGQTQSYEIVGDSPPVIANAEEKHVLSFVSTNDLSGEYVAVWNEVTTHKLILNAPWDKAERCGITERLVSPSSVVSITSIGDANDWPDMRRRLYLVVVTNTEQPFLLMDDTNETVSPNTVRIRRCLATIVTNGTERTSKLDKRHWLCLTVMRSVKKPVALPYQWLMSATLHRKQTQ
jgi:hypothetical protein